MTGLTGKIFKNGNMEQLRCVGAGKERKISSGIPGYGCPLFRMLLSMGRFLLGLAVCLFSGTDVMARVSKTGMADTLSGYAGEKEQAEEKGLFLIGDYEEGKVRLRWAVRSYAQWKHVMEKGIVLERYGFNAKELEPLAGDSLRTIETAFSDKTDIFLPPFLKKDTAVLSAWAGKDAYAALLGEAVHAPGLHLSVGQVSVPDWAALRTRQEDENLRFVLANLAYDRSFPVACLGGMGYEDTLLQADRYYLYRIFLRDVSDTALLGTDTAVFFTRQEKSSPPAFLPSFPLQVDFSRNTVRIRWKGMGPEVPVVGYYVERAGKGTGFRRLHREPYMDFVQRNGRWISYTDSLPEVGKEYRYRVLARDLFGQEWEVARSGFGKGSPVLETPPMWDSLACIGNTLHLYWSFPEEEQDCLSGFSLYALPFPSADLSGYPVLSNLSPKKRSCRLDRKRLPFGSSYLYLAAEGKEPGRKISLPLFWQDVDSVPPPIPDGLEARVDSTGILSLMWRTVEAEDCAGYRVFFALSPGGEPVQLTRELLSDTVFPDTVSLHTDRTFFYAVCSEDKRGNRSALSPWLEADNGLPRKPDPPVFSFHGVSDGEKAVLRWENIPSPFLRGQELQYRVDGSPWMLLKDFPKTSSSSVLPDTYVFAFPSSSRSRQYDFRLMAYGEDRERDTAYSPFCHSVWQEVRPETASPVLSVDRKRGFVHVQWRNPDRGDVKRIYLYRKKEGEGLLLLATLSAPQVGDAYHVDSSVEMNTLYHYCLQMEFSDGSWSDMSEMTGVEY